MYIDYIHLQFIEMYLYNIIIPMSYSIVTKIGDAHCISNLIGTNYYRTV